jgi:two-component sensor histidine kinase
MNSLNPVSAELELQSRASSNGAVKVQIAAQRRIQAIATVHQQLHLAGSLEFIGIEGLSGQSRRW